jgi:transcriptional regulator with XRE-family HTH domain
VIVISIELARMRGLLTILADETAQAFGAAVRQVRLERGETLEDVATRVPRLYAKYLGEIERGWHSPSLTTARRIAHGLDVTLSSLVCQGRSNKDPRLAD